MHQINTNSRSLMKRGSGIEGMRKGPWTPEEDAILLEHVRNNGARNWSLIAFLGLLPRTGKSCRLRWVNKLRPGLKKGRKFTPEEEQKVIDLQAQFGNKWATIAKYFPGRTDNDVKNFWSIHCKRLARAQNAPRVPLLSISNQVEGTETVTVASFQELNPSQGEAQGSNSTGNSSSARPSAIPDPQPDPNPTRCNSIQNPLPQPVPFDPIFDLPPLPEFHFLQPEHGFVNLSRNQCTQSTQLIEPEPEVGSKDLGPAQCINPNHQCLKSEPHVDSGMISECMDPVPPFFSPLPLELDDLADILDSFEQPAPQGASLRNLLM